MALPAMRARACDGISAATQPHWVRMFITTATSGRSAAAYSNGFSTRTSKREKARSLRVTTVRSCTRAVAAIMASS
jgi:hypothetical protein